MRKKMIFGCFVATRTYRCWGAMCDRHLYDGPNKYMSYYKNVKVFSVWRKNYMAFLNHVGPCPGKEYSIDRIDNFGHYYPGNVRWATKEQQMNNTKQNNFVTFRGETLTVAVMARKYNVPNVTFRERYFNNGWSLKRSLTTPVASRTILMLTYKGITKPLSYWCKTIGVSGALVRYRKRNGWSDARTLSTPVRNQQRHLYEFNGKVQSLKRWAKECGLAYETLRYRVVDGGWSIGKSLTTDLWAGK